MLPIIDGVIIEDTKEGHFVRKELISKVKRISEQYPEINE